MDGLGRREGRDRRAGVGPTEAPPPLSRSRGDVGVPIPSLLGWDPAPAGERCPKQTRVH